MSATSISRAANDPQLRARVDALTQKEIYTNTTAADSDFGKRLQAGVVNASPLYWAVAVDTETAYEQALLDGNGSPGYDETVITDAAISASITAHWPPDPVLTPTLTAAPSSTLPITS